MGYAEKRGGSWRARWRNADGFVCSASGFGSKKEALDYAQDRELGRRVFSFTRRQLIEALRNRKPQRDTRGRVVVLEGDAALEALADSILDEL